MKLTTAAGSRAIFVTMFAFSSATAATEVIDLSSLVGEPQATEAEPAPADTDQTAPADSVDTEQPASDDIVEPEAAKDDLPVAEPEAAKDSVPESDPEVAQDTSVEAASEPGEGAVKIAADEPGLTDEEQVIAVQQAWIDAEVSRDEAVLNRVLDDRYIINSNSGTPGNKAGAIAAVMGWNLASQTVSNQTVLVDGDTAIIMGTAHFGIAVLGQPNASSAARYTSTYIKRNGQWRVIALQMNGIRTN